MILEHISIIKELMRSPVRPIGTSGLKLMHKGLFRRIGKALGIDNIRIYTSTLSGRTMMPEQVTGDRSVWNTTLIDFSKIKKDITFHKNFYFFRIKYSDNNGKLITIGYLGIYVENKSLNQQELGLLELLCLLYGDYVRKRILFTASLKVKKNLLNIVEIAYSKDKPGSIISKCQVLIYKSIRPYNSFYAVIDGNKLFFEYLKRESTGGSMILKPISINLPIVFTNRLYSSNKSFTTDACDSDLINLLAYLHKYDKNIDENYTIYFYPLKVDGQILGAWVFIFSNKQFFDIYELDSLIEIASPLIQSNYKFIFQRRTKKMVIEPIFKNRDTRIDSTKVFVLMPFTLEWSNRIWQQMLKPTIEKVGMTPIRADDLYGHDIMEDVWSGIVSANIVIADITGRNPNVFYELGIAHTLGKKVVLLTQNKDDIPFDLNRYRHIIYQDNFDGYELLKSKLETSLLELSR